VWDPDTDPAELSYLFALYHPGHLPLPEI
jgi:hypothetical protein